MAELLSPVISEALERRVEALLTRACTLERCIAVAESCTGGALAALLTDVPGCSHAFERGFVTYTDESKHEMLGVPETLLKDPGPVSEVVARAMAEGAIDASRADIAVSITGFAEVGQPPGLVHLATAVRGGPTLHRREHYADTGRAAVRLAAIETAVAMIEERLG